MLPAGGPAGAAASGNVKKQRPAPCPPPAGRERKYAGSPMRAPRTATNSAADALVAL